MNYERPIERLERQIGELSGKVDIILKKLDEVEELVRQHGERITRCENAIDDCNDKIQNHLRWHERQKGWNIQWKIAILAALVASGSSALFSLLISLIR